MPPTTTQNPRHGSRNASDPAVDGDAYSSGDLVLETMARGFYVDTGGDVIVDFVGGIYGRTTGTQVTFANVPAGTVLPICFTKVYNGSTSGVVLY